MRTPTLEPCAWRRFALPSSMPLAGVHQCIQHAFGLPNSGLYGFENNEVRIDLIGQDLMWMGEDAERWDVTRVTLAEILDRPPCRYIYGGLECVVERDELPSSSELVEGEHELVSSVTGWRVSRRDVFTQRIMDLSGVARDARHRAGLDGVTMRQIPQREGARVEGEGGDSSPPSPSTLAPSRVVAPPEVLSPEALRDLVMQSHARWRTREELDAIILAHASQSQKTHDRYIRQLAAGMLWRARLPAREEAPLDVHVYEDTDEFDTAGEGATSRTSLPERFEEVTWSLPVHPSLKLLLRAWPVGRLDEVASRYGVELGGRRREREARLSEAMCDVEQAMERAQTWGEEVIEIVSELCRDGKAVRVEELLQRHRADVLEALVHEGVVFPGEHDTRGLMALIPAEMVQVWRLVFATM